MSNIVALVFRLKTKCKQYAFESVEDLEKWGSRKPYANEDVIVVVIKDRMIRERKKLNAMDAAEFVKGSIK